MNLNDFDIPSTSKKSTGKSRNNSSRSSDSSGEKKKSSTSKKKSPKKRKIKLPEGFQLEGRDEFVGKRTRRFFGAHIPTDGTITCWAPEDKEEGDEGCINFDI